MISGRDKFVLVLLAAGLFSLFIYGSYKLPFIGPDEPRYSQVARQMHDSGDYIVPRLGENPWFEKPVLLYWIISVSYSIFGINEFAARFPSALCALIAVLLTATMVKKVTDLSTAIVAALILATCIFFVGFSHAATFDMLLTATITAAFTAFFFYELDRKKAGWIYLFYILSGLAVLAKGFAAPILIGLTIASYFIGERRLRDLFKLKLIPGSVLSLLVMGIWFVPITLKYGSVFWNDFFLQHHLMRFTSSQYHHSGGPFFYLPVLFVGTFPWTFAPLLAVKNVDGPKRKLLIRFSLCWFLATVLFFSLSLSKLPGYVLPAMPPFAILGGISMMDFFRRPSSSRKRIILLAVPLNLLMVAALLVGAAIRPALQLPLFIMAASIVFITFLTWLFIHKNQLTNALCVYPLIVVAAAVLTATQIPPRLNWFESKQLASQAQPLIARGIKLALYNVYDFSFVFYTNGRVELTHTGYFFPLRTYADLHRYAIAKGEVLVLVGNEELPWMEKADFWKVAHVFRGNERSIVHITSARQ